MDAPFADAEFNELKHKMKVVLNLYKGNIQVHLHVMACHILHCAAIVQQSWTEIIFRQRIVCMCNFCKFRGDLIVWFLNGISAPGTC